MIFSISQIHVPVKDLKRAVAFYRDVLGMKFLFEVPNMAFFDCDGVRVMLGVPESPEFNHPASIIYYSVDNILHVHATLRSSGVQFVSEPHKVADLGEKELLMAFFRDSENNTAAITEERMSGADEGQEKEDDEIGGGD